MRLCGLGVVSGAMTGYGLVHGTTATGHPSRYTLKGRRRACLEQRFGDERRKVVLLTSRDIAALNRARTILKRVEDAASRRALIHPDPYAPVTAWDLGRLSESASVADDALFSFLSTARSHCRLNITDAQLFGPERAQTQTAREIGSAQPIEVPTSTEESVARAPLERDLTASLRATRKRRPAR